MSSARGIGFRGWGLVFRVSILLSGMRLSLFGAPGLLVFYLTRDVLFFPELVDCLGLDLRNLES